MRRDVILSVRVTQREYDFLNDEAGRTDRSIGAVVRRRLFQRDDLEANGLAQRVIDAVESVFRQPS
jgi:hypothetical protein